MRSVTGTGLVVTALVATAAALLFPVLSFAGRNGGGGGPGGVNAQTVATQFGPLSALDRDFVQRVRLAGLWELPAGRQAQERGTTRAVRTAGDHLVEGHAELDRRVRELAAQLALSLPNRPTAQQRDWLAQLTAARGAQYDRTFANLLRAAHGKVFTVVAQVRATTRNTLVRGLADSANTTVLDHIAVLEQTGFVDFDAIAREAATASPPPSPTAAPPSIGAATAAPPVPLSPSATYSLPPPATPPADLRSPTATSDRPDRTSRTGRNNRADRTSRADQSSHARRADPSSHADRTGQSNRADRTGRTAPHAERHPAARKNSPKKQPPHPGHPLPPEQPLPPEEALRPDQSPQHHKAPRHEKSPQHEKK